MDGGEPSTQRGGGNYHDSRVAFYSVDVYVDCIEEMSVGCRVPSVVFQFLDFPPITVFSPASGEVRPREEMRRLDFSQGKSCVFEMLEVDLAERMRRQPLRVSWADTWQLKERELGAVAIPMVVGMNRKVRSRPAHVQQGRFRLQDDKGRHVCTISLRLSVVTHGDTMAPDLLQNREYHSAPQKQGMREDWEAVIKRMVREYYQNQKKESSSAAADGRKTHAGVATTHTHDSVRPLERKIQQSEEAVVRRLDSISQRMAQLQRANLALTGTVQKLETRAKPDRLERVDRLRVSELEAQNAKLQEQLVEMARLQRTSARSLEPTQILHAIKFQVSELLKRNPSFDLQRVFDAFDVDGDGIVSTDEFVLGLRELGITLEPVQVPKMLELLPTDERTGQIVYKTFVSLFGGKEQHILTDISNQVRHIIKERGLKLQQAFQAMDTSHNGAITREEFAAGLRTLQIDLHPDKLQELVRVVASSGGGGEGGGVGGGLINYYDFMSHFGELETDWDWSVSASVQSDSARTSLEWAVLRGRNDPVVIAPDGWDRTDLSRSLLEPITLSTYLRRINRSVTVKPPPRGGQQQQQQQHGANAAGAAAASGGSLGGLTGGAEDNTVWIREALLVRPVPSRPPQQRTAEVEKDALDERPGQSCGMKDYVYTPPALTMSFQAAPPVASAAVDSKRQPLDSNGQGHQRGPTPNTRATTRANAVASSGRRGAAPSSSATARRRVHRAPHAGRARKPAKAAATRPDRGQVLDTLVDVVSYGNVTDHATELLAGSGLSSPPAVHLTSAADTQHQTPRRKHKQQHKHGGGGGGGGSSRRISAGDLRELRGQVDDGSGADSDAYNDGQQRGELIGTQRSPGSVARHGVGRRKGSPEHMTPSRALTSFVGSIGLGGQHVREVLDGLAALGAETVEDCALLNEHDLRAVGLSLIVARRVLRAVDGTAGTRAPTDGIGSSSAAAASGSVQGPGAPGYRDVQPPPALAPAVASPSPVVVDPSPFRSSEQPLTPVKESSTQPAASSAVAMQSLESAPPVSKPATSPPAEGGGKATDELSSLRREAMKYGLSFSAAKRSDEAQLRRAISAGGAAEAAFQEAAAAAAGPSTAELKQELLQTLEKAEKEAAEAKEAARLQKEMEEAAAAEKAAQLQKEKADAEAAAEAARVQKERADKEKVQQEKAARAQKDEDAAATAAASATSAPAPASASDEVMEIDEYSDDFSVSGRTPTTSAPGGGGGGGKKADEVEIVEEPGTPGDNYANESFDVQADDSISMDESIVVSEAIADESGVAEEILSD